MDRCHRICQTKPVHVYRLATSNSVEVCLWDDLQTLTWLIFVASGLISSLSQGRIIKRAFGKLKLEHVVIGKGQFEQNSAKPNVLDVKIFASSVDCVLVYCVNCLFGKETLKVEKQKQSNWE